ncbi:glycosyltransferase family 4 protein [Ectobacillus funiculus]|uniref:Glycosyltransferase family 4 protein n=1 Tax=Ectobacillus funiculus TaxID=137993 RepID=A0ABV5WCE8_9BACI
MRIAVVNNYVPFVYGGAEFLADNLTQKLNEYGHEAILVKIPFKGVPPQEIINHMHASRFLHFKQFFDLVIPLKFPAYHVNHPNKTVWLLHQFRQVYDLWGTQFQGIPNTAEGLKVKSDVIQSDNKFLKEAKKIYTISNVVSDRLKKFNNIESEVLYPPLMDAEKFFCKSFGDYLFFPSRINNAKRQHMAVESMRYTKSNVKLIIAGNPERKQYLDRIQSIINQYNLSNKVRIINQFISQEEKISLMANSLGCLYIPHDEEYGYVTLEAFYSLKPVITCTDSGGTHIFVQDNITGFSVNPEPKAIAEAMDNLFENKKKAEDMGKAGFEKIQSMNITWERVVRRLTE